MTAKHWPEVRAARQRMAATLRVARRQNRGLARLLRQHMNQARDQLVREAEAAGVWRMP